LKAGKEINFIMMRED